MALKPTPALTATLATAALLLSACGSGDADDDGTLTIETSAEAGVDADAPDDDSAEGDILEEDLQGEGGIVPLSGADYEFALTCSRGAADVDLMITGRASGAMMSAAFGADDPSELMTVVIDGVSWTATSGADSDDFASLDVDVDGGTVVGTAEFLGDGETETGSFELNCS